ncbi:MAG: DUF4296 domain-containing protein [Bacteroidales bacterium]|nr:DUF4296 domain-containing protein [Bacteroidales bacterium]
MKIIRVIILCCVLAAAISCTPRGIIPKRKMAAINAEMFLFDQYAAADREIKRITDTTAIYKPLLRSYGYTADDYFRSLEYYLDNSREMAEVLDMTEKILKKRENKILRRIEAGARKNDTTIIEKPRKQKKSDESDDDELPKADETLRMN